MSIVETTDLSIQTIGDLLEETNVLLGHNCVETPFEVSFREDHPPETPFAPGSPHSPNPLFAPNSPSYDSPPVLSPSPSPDLSPPSLDLSPSPPDLSPSPPPDQSSSPALSWQPSLSSLSEEESDDDAATEGLSLPTTSTQERRPRKCKAKKKTKEVDLEDVGRTSRWRRRTQPMKNKRTKTYSCKVCGEAMLLTTGHTQYYGARYCPQQQHISRAEWMEKMRRERRAGIKKKTNTTVQKEPTDKRKTYTCGICGKPAKSAGHSCFSGVRYCPNKPGQDMTKEEWLVKMKAQGKVKKPTPRCGTCREIRTKATGHEFFKGLWYCPSAPGQIDFEEWVTQRHIEYDIFNS